jgi:hypothetical protein
MVLMLMPFLFSCEKEIEFKGGEVKPLMVMNGFLQSDSAVKVHLSASRFFLDDRDFKALGNAEVELWKDGAKIENLVYDGNGWYKGSCIARQGDVLTLKATCAGYDAVEAETEILRPTPLLQIDTANLAHEITYDKDTYYLTMNGDIDLVFQDDADKENYYELNTYIKLYYADGHTSIHSVYFKSDAIVYHQSGTELNFDDDDYDSTYGEPYPPFSDELINGKKYSMKIKIKDFHFYSYWTDNTNYSNQIPVRTEFCAELVSLTRSIYLFSTTRKTALDSYNTVVELFSEPVQIHSNVKGGIGLLGNFERAAKGVELK